MPIEDAEELASYRARLQGTNINPQTFLATDYLNHFNEIVMLLELLPDMPEMFADASAWRPKSYQDHFRESQFRERDLAIEAYERAPAKYRKPFDDTVAQMDLVIMQALDLMREAIDSGDMDGLRRICQENVQLSYRLIEQANAVIHGEQAVDQSDIDRLMDGGGQPAADQSDIDRLFGD